MKGKKQDFRVSRAEKRKEKEGRKNSRKMGEKKREIFGSTVGGKGK